MNLARLTIGQRIALGFSTLVLLLVAAVALGWIGLDLAKANFADYRTCARHSVLAGRIQANALEMRLAAKEFTISRSAGAAESYQARHARLAEFVAQAAETLTDGDEPALVASIGQHMREHAAALASISTSAATLTAEDILAIDQQLAGVGELLARETEDLKLAIIGRQDEIGPRAQADISRTVTRVWLTGGGGVLVAILLSILITRAIKRRLRTIAHEIGAGSEQVAAAAHQVAGSSQSLAQGASEQAASLEQTSSAVEEISGIARHNAGHASRARDLSAETRRVAEAGAAAVSEMNTAMQAINTSAHEVGHILKTIDEIAFQTNILALNAAVEAARAGDHGAGFAVVADEVRNLARRAAESARETATRIEESIRNSEAGTRISARATESIAAILARTGEVDQLITEIARASSEQSRGVTEVATATTEMDKVTQTNAANAEETAAAAQELLSQAALQDGSVRALLALVEGARPPLAPPADASHRPLATRRLAPHPAEPAPA